MKKVKATLGGLAAALVLGTLALPASADTINITASYDGQLSSGNGAYQTPYLRVGKTYDGWAVFKLPDITGQTITGANLTFSVPNSVSMTETIDLYVLGYITSYTSPNGAWKTWYYIGANDTITTGTSMGTNIGSSHPPKIASDLFPSTIVHGTNYDLTSGEQSTLATTVQDLYNTDGAAANDYLVIRLNPDSFVSGDSAYYQFNTPTLTLTTAPAITIPEPAAASMVVGLLTIAGGFGRRRQR